MDSKCQLYINEIHNGEMQIKYKGQQSRKDASKMEKVMGKTTRDRVVYAVGSIVIFCSLQLRYMRTIKKEKPIFLLTHI